MNAPRVHPPFCKRDPDSAQQQSTADAQQPVKHGFVCEFRNLGRCPPATSQQSLHDRHGQPTPAKRCRSTGKTDCNTLNVSSLLALRHDTAPAILHRQGHCTPKSHPQAAYFDSDHTAMANCKSHGRAHTKFAKASAGPCQENNSSLKAEWATEDRMSLGKGGRLLVPWVRTSQGTSKHNC